MANTLTVGQQAPDFSLQDADGRTYSKEGLAGQRFILYLPPKAATPGCTTEAGDFRDTPASLPAGGSAGPRVCPA
ncbi:redoxin domain-containing protein, partial [Mycobacterium tuberculosis]|nr:redoxin domain-containing protein [Mycobacterium tuberculosis]